MYSAAKEVDGTGTVDTTSNAAERLKLNQATSTSAGENSNQQVTVQGKKRAVSQFIINDFILFLLSYIIPFIYHSFPLLFPVSSCRLKVGNFSSHSVPSFSFLALPTPPFSSPLDTYLSSRLVPSLVLFLPCPALPRPPRCLSPCPSQPHPAVSRPALSFRAYLTLHSSTPLSSPFSSHLHFTLFDSIEPRHNECWWKWSRRSLRRNRFTWGWHGRRISKRDTYRRKFIRRRWHWRFRTWRSGNCRLTNAEDSLDFDMTNWNIQHKNLMMRAVAIMTVYWILHEVTARQCSS